MEYDVNFYSNRKRRHCIYVTKTLHHVSIIIRHLLSLIVLFFHYIKKKQNKTKQNKTKTKQRQTKYINYHTFCGHLIEV